MVQNVHKLHVCIFKSELQKAGLNVILNNLTLFNPSHIYQQAYMLTYAVQLALSPH
jgi:hypothetical protein